MKYATLIISGNIGQTIQDYKDGVTSFSNCRLTGIRNGKPFVIISKMYPKRASGLKFDEWEASHCSVNFRTAEWLTSLAMRYKKKAPAGEPG